MANNITEREIDIFATPTNYAIAHQANCFNTLGDGSASGIAKLIGERYPQAAEADAATKKGDYAKLGTLSTAKGADGRLIINAYSQFDFDFGGDKPTDYEAVHTVFSEIKKRLTKRNEAAKDQDQSELHLALPYGYGSVRGGASWRVIRMLIEVIFEDAPFKVSICRVPGQAQLL